MNRKSEDRYTEHAAKFCLLSTQRSGSTWLMTLLASHPGVAIYNEPFVAKHVCESPRGWNLPYFFRCHSQMGWFRPLSTCTYLTRLQESAPRASAAVGFKLMYNQFFLRPEIAIKLARDRYRVVHLVRENLLDVLLSKEVARKTGLMFSTEKVDAGTVTLPNQRLLWRLRKANLYLQTARVVLRLLPFEVCTVYYDQLQQNPEETVRSIFRFMDIANENVVISSDQIKINQAAHRDVIANYDEIRRLLRNTCYAKMLN